jgi:hypothetical protein
MLQFVQSFYVFSSGIEHGLREFAKALGRHGGKERVFVRKMAVGRVVRNLGAPRDLAESKRGRAHFGDGLKRRLEENLA